MNLDRRSKEFFAFMERKSKQTSRGEYRTRIVSLHKSMSGSKLVYEQGPMHHTWKDIVLYDKAGKKVASVCTTGGVFLNHWLTFY